MITLFRKIRKQLMSQNKVSKYLVYAIGEIALVVIGIFLAVQVNDWNEDRKAHKIITSNKAILIENLEADLEKVKNVIVLIDSERTVLNQFVERINGPKANLDTVIKITINELRGAVSGIRFENDDAYNAMVLSSEVNLFENELKKKLFAVYYRHERIEISYRSEFENYMDARKLLLEKYPSAVNLYSGPIYESVWSRVDLNDLTSRLLFVVQRKRVMYGIMKGGLELLEEQTSDLLELLKISQLND